jgi:N-acetylmuramic acid 6-phosphate etherase
MGTEIVSPRYAGIDAWEPSEILEALVEGQLAAVAAVRAARRSIEQAALAMETRLRAGGRIVYAGAGTSGRLAAQDGAELTPTFSWPAERVLLLLAGGEEAILQAVEGAEDRSEDGAAIIRHHGVGAADTLIALAASGTTPFTLGCLREAKAAGALAIGIANNAETPLLTEADHGIWLDTGPESIAGSTRMKAGTAQKVTLNLLSSLVMIRLGRVYGGLMVDVQASNEKLVRRSENMLVHLSGRSHEDAREALAAADGSVKRAALLLQGCSSPEAEALLDRADGQLRTALRLAGAPSEETRDR